jgi:acetyl-CoA acetyltransferase
MPPRKAVIVGVAATRQARLIEDASSLDLAHSAVLAALDDCGIPVADVDGLAVDWPGPGGAPGDVASWAKLLGIVPRWVADSAIGCMGIRGVAAALAAVSFGACEVAVVGGAVAGPAAAARFATVRGEDREFQDCWGTYVVPNFALIAQRHMHEFGTTQEQLATVAATIRNHGHANPEAVMFGRGPYTVDDILASPPIATPFHRLDVALNAQGGGAVVVTTSERARMLPSRPVAMLASDAEFPDASYVNPPVYREVGQLGRVAVRRALGRAGLASNDLDVFQLYDATSFEVIRQFEVLGLCAEGEGGPFIEEAGLGLDGRHPTNLDGGLLSYAWCGGHQMTLKVVECVKQLRGEAGTRQVENAATGIVTNAGPGAHHFEVAIMARDF